MWRHSAFPWVVLGLLFTASSCAKLDLFKRSESNTTLAAGPRVGTLAPEIDGEDMDGARFKLSDYRGKIVVVSFWASWCAPCRAMIPHERALVERFGEHVVVLGVNLDENRQAAARVIKSDGITWRNWNFAGWDNPANHQYGVTTIPRFFVIDAGGVLRYANVRGSALDDVIATLLAEKR